MSLTTTLIYSLTKSQSAITNPVAQAGYRATFTVTEAVNIDANIFVRQREVNEPTATNFIDSFYSVASVADMAGLAVGFSSMNNPFYRVDTITLVFPTLNELEKYTEQIKAMIEDLRKSNDLDINLLASEVIGLPSGSPLTRYWGVSAALTVTDSDLHGFSQDTIYSNAKSIDFTTSAPRYLYFAYRDELGAPTTVTVNAVADVPVLVQRAVVHVNGYSHTYRIYRTSATHTGATNLTFA